LREYEGLFILKPEIEKEELTGLYQKIQENVKKYKGEPAGVEEWGKKLLTNKIKKYREGIYYIMKFRLDPSNVKKLDADLKLNESILRVMFTQV
jgi:small subunit ribosomal protein S6